ncbi:MAG: hypothetical protein WBA12_06475 [Catalinimonas sp.]
MTSTLPIVFVHRGNSRYLFYSLRQARRWNPDADIYLLGTQESRHLARWVTHVSVEDYRRRADAFAAVYQHHSRLGYDFELFCIQRWFILLDFMERHDIERCVALDTDILVYTDLAEAVTQLPQDGITMTGWSPHTNYVSRREVLEAFCTFVQTHYEGSHAAERLQELVSKVHEQVPGAAGISDMSWFWHFAEVHPGKVTQLMHERAFGVWDNSITYADGFQMIEGSKRITWRDGLPYGISEKSGTPRRFFLLHFQGTGKPLLYRNLRPQGKGLAFWRRWADAIYWAQRVRKKLTSGA